MWSKPRPSIISSSSIIISATHLGVVLRLDPVLSRLHSLCRSSGPSHSLQRNVSLSAAELRGPPGSLEAASAEETPDHQRLHDPDEEPGRWRERKGTPVHS